MLARFRRPKIACSPSYVDFRPKINAVILVDMCNPLRGHCIVQGYQKGRKPKT
jgi:hypothetical protein